MMNKTPKPANPHREVLTAEAVTILKRYEDFSSNYKVEFTQVPGQLRIAARLTRPDGTPFAESSDPIDKKLSHLKDQTAVIRPFFLPQMKNLWDESDVNDFKEVDFDFAAILGYDQKEDGTLYIKNLYFPSADAFLTGRKPNADGVYHIPLATFNANRMSIDPRKSFAKFIYLAERMGEALEYQYDTHGHFRAE